MLKFVQINFTLFFMQKSTTFINTTSLDVNLEPTLLYKLQKKLRSLQMSFFQPIFGELHMPLSNKLKPKSLRPFKNTYLYHMLTKEL